MTHLPPQVNQEGGPEDPRGSWPGAAGHATIRRVLSGVASPEGDLSHRMTFMLQPIAPLLSSPKPPPLWYVRNQERVVGPVTTNLLVRGVAARRVPDGCLVREHSWRHWRDLESLREIAALRRDQSRHGRVVVPRARYRARGASPSIALEGLARRLLGAADPGEVLFWSLTEAMERTRARVGVAYRPRPPYIGYVASAASGPGMHARLGHVLPRIDPVIQLATSGRVIFGAPEAHPVARLLAERLGTAAASHGVAMVPVLCAGRLYGLIELGRTDHPFREADRAVLRSIVLAARNRLGVVQNAVR